MKARTFIDYSSAFNTIQPHLMLNKLNALNVPAYLQLWILDYLTERSQYVRTKYGVSDIITVNTGAPQGCVLSPVLFVLYTNDLAWDTNGAMIEKYADDTAVVGFISNDDDSEYVECIEFVNTWCKDNYLDLNVPKQFQKTCFLTFDRIKQKNNLLKLTICKSKEHQYIDILAVWLMINCPLLNMWTISSKKQIKGCILQGP